MDVYVQGSRVVLQPAQLLGQGGEAEVYRYGADSALKVFKSPDHPDYQLDVKQKRAAEERLELHQEKLHRFPVGLPGAVIAPQTLATDRKGRRTVGYVMRRIEPADPLLRYGEVTFRRSGVSNAQVLDVFTRLHETLTALHRAGVVVGDLNDANILVRRALPYLIDADSFQFGPYLCRVFTERFVDPLRCDATASAPMLGSPFTEQSDWYAFSVLLFQSLLCVGPHGGVYRPKDPANRVPPAARPLRRVSVFHPEVQYPKPARPLQSMPDGILRHFREVFVKDLRRAFPRALLEAVTWNTCASCGLEHARACCPVCAPHAAASAHTRVIARGDVRAYSIAEVRGVFVHVSTPTHGLEWVAHERGDYRRENGEVVWKGGLDPELEFRIAGRATFVLKHGQVTRVEGGRLEQFSADCASGRTVLHTGSGVPIWASQGEVLRPSALGLERVGSVLEGQTRFWSGRRFAFGFYRAGNVLRGFTFSTTGSGINDRVPLPQLTGVLVDASCAIGDSLAWISVTSRDGGQGHHACWVVSRSGQLMGAATGPAVEERWFATLRGACVVGDQLFVPTDAGILRVSLGVSGAFETKLFPDTEPFVDAASRLVFAQTSEDVPARICVVSSSRILALEMK